MTVQKIFLILCLLALVSPSIMIGGCSNPRISSVTPNEVALGETSDVVIDGGNLANVSYISFGAGIVVNNFQIESPSQIKANITINSNASLGVRGMIFRDAQDKRYDLPSCITVTVKYYENIPLTINYTRATSTNQEITVTIETAPGASCTAIAVSSSDVRSWRDRIAGDTGIVTWTQNYRNFDSERHQLTITVELRGKTTSKHIIVNY